MAQEAPARTKIPTKSPQPARSGAARPAGRWRGACIKATFAVIAPERELAWTGVAMGWIKAIDRFRLAPTGDGQTTVTMEETMSGPLLTLFYNDGKLQISCRCSPPAICSSGAAAEP
jgi:hypothetical protein